LINLIWDIDGTILNTRGLGAAPFCEAFTDHTGYPAVIDKKKLSGFTDFEIALSLMKDAGLQKDIFLAERILNSFSKKLERALSTNPPELLGDIQNTLEHTEITSDFVNSIGTGNFRAGAIVKLKSAGIFRYFENSKFHVATPELWNRDAIIGSAAKANQEFQNLVIGIAQGTFFPQGILVCLCSLLVLVSILLKNYTTYILTTFWTGLGRSEIS